MSESDIQALVDRMSIIDTFNRYAYGADMRDWDIYRSVFTDEVEVDMTSLGSPSPSTVSGDEWAERVRTGLSRYRATHHLMSNFTITVNGDEATCTTYIQATHYLPDDEGGGQSIIRGYYTNTLVRTPEGWKIRKLKLTSVGN